MIELTLLSLFFAISLLLIFRNKRLSLYVLLILSLFLHKEFFSIYRWDVLPIRVFMLAFLVYGLFNLGLLIWRERNLKKIFVIIKNSLSEPFTLLLGSIWLVRGASIFFSKNLEASLLLFGFFTTILLLGYFLYSQLKDKPKEAESFIRFFIYLVFGLTIFAYIQLFVFLKFGVSIGAIWSIPNNLPRLGSLFWDVNHFGALLACVMPVLGAYVLVEKNLKLRIFNLFMFLSMLCVLFMTNSRTSWIAALVGLIVFCTVYLVRRFGFKGIGIVVLTIFLISSSLLFAYSQKESPFRNLVKSYLNYRVDSSDSHMYLLEGAFEIFDQYPVLGGGYGSFFEQFSKTDIAPIYFGKDPAGLSTRVPAHTIWGEAVAETGVVGVGLIILFFGLVIGTLIYAGLNLKNTKEYLLSSAMGSALTGLLVAGIFYSYNSEFFWILVFLYFIYGFSLLKDKIGVSDLLAFFGRSKHLYLITLLIVGGFLIFWQLGSTHLIPWDEAIYAKISKNMVISGEYIEEYWHPNKIWYEKPPLYMWISAFFMNFLGFESLAPRLGSAILGFATVILVYFFGKKILNRTAGFVAAFSLLTTFQFLYYSRTAMLDVSATFFITLSLYLYWLAVNTLSSKSKKATLYWLFSGLACGAAVMIKGVVGFVPFGVIGLYEIYSIIEARSIARFVIWKYLIFLGASILVFMPWHLEMYRRFGYEFFENYIGYHVIDRATTSIEGKGRPFFWYITVLKVSMRLWFIALLAAFPFTLYKAFKKQKAFIFLSLGSLFIFLFFSSATSKLIWYIMPLYPLLALIIGAFVDRFIESFLKFVPNTKMTVKFLLVFVGVLISLAYLRVNRELVYTSDLTGPQALLLQAKDLEFGAESPIYADRIELPLVLYYSDSPYFIVDYKPLKKVLEDAGYDESIIFITKESRYKNFLDLYTNIKLVSQQDEWVLCRKEATYSVDKKRLEVINKDIAELKKSYVLSPTYVTSSSIRKLELAKQDLEQEIAENLE